MRFLFFAITVASIMAGDVSLNAPASMPAGAPFEVTWTGGEVKGAVISLATADGGRLAGASYGYISAKGVVKLGAPVKAGSYAIVYKKGNQVITSVPLQVTPVTASLSLPAAVGMRETMQVQWQGPEYAGALVQIYSTDGKKVGGAYAYVANAKGKPIKLVAPETPGEYELRYLIKSEVLAVARFRVEGVEASLQTKTNAQAGAELAVVWVGPENKGDRIMLAQVGAAKPLRGSSYAYVGNSVANTVSLTLPDQPGAYEVVYLTGNTIIARTPVSVTPVTASLEAPAEVIGTLAFQVKWRGPGNRGDLITMVDPASGKALRFYAYIDPLVDTVTLTAPETPGTYALHYRTAKGSDLASHDLVVTPPPAEPGSLQVNRDVKQGLGPGSAVEVILDASGSMLQRQDGVRRIEIAKATLTELVRDILPAGTGFALRVFGHKESGSCRTDLEMALAPLDAAAATNRIAAIQAKNLAKTPIAASLAMVASDLKEVRGDRVVVLVTDGEETCDGDPVLAIKALRAKGWDVRLNIVGYAIDDETLGRTFESWAALGGGRYLNAAGGDELAAAVKAAVAIPFEIVDETGAVRGQGLANGEALSLPAGNYRIRYRSGAKQQEIAVTVSAGQLTSTNLK